MNMIKFSDTQKDLFNFCYYSFYSLTLAYLAGLLPKDDQGSNQQMFKKT